MATCCGEWAPCQWITSRHGEPKTPIYHCLSLLLPVARCRQPLFVTYGLKSLLRMITEAPRSLIKPPGSSFMAKCHPAPRVFSLSQSFFSSLLEEVNDRRVVLLQCGEVIVFQLAERKEVFNWRLQTN